jgi:hypothetical protein
MELKINRKKLPVKYALEIYQDLSGYPTHADLEYILVCALEDQGILDKDFTAESVWKRMKSALGTVKDLTKFLDYLSEEKEIADFNVNLNKTSANSYKLTSHRWA